MKRIVMYMTSMLLAGVSASAESYDYEVVYKLGFIDKVAAHGTVNTNTDGDNLFATLQGNSISWDGRVYMVNDTLQAQITKGPKGVAQQTGYIGGLYAKPLTHEYYTGCENELRSNPNFYRTISGKGYLSASAQTMEAIDITAQMLGMYRIGQLIDFENLEPGSRFYIPITDTCGTTSNIEIIYEGRTQSSEDIEAYNLTLRYPYMGTLSNYPISCLISVDDRIPLQFSAHLLIGHLMMQLVR